MAPYDANLDSDIALIEEILAIVTTKPPVPTMTFSPAAAKAAEQARLAAKVLKTQKLAARIKSHTAASSAQLLLATLSVQTLAEYEEKIGRASWSLAPAAPFSAAP